jgi:hypothetical protein
MEVGFRHQIFGLNEQVSKPGHGDQRSSIRTKEIKKGSQMRKLLIATAAVLAFASAAQAAPAWEIPDDFSQCKEITSPYGKWSEVGRWVTEMNCWSFASAKNVKLIYDANGQLDAIDDGETLRVKNWFARSGQEERLTFYYTPAGQLPECNAAEILKVLARINNRTLAFAPASRTLGTRNGKNFCNGYTVERMDDGRFWVQMTWGVAQ